MADAGGTLYNREAIIKFLLDRHEYGDGEEVCGHIRTLRDVRTLKLTANPTVRPGEVEGMGTTSTVPKAQFVCPITQREMDGSGDFYYGRDCGCVVSGRAVRELGKDQCLGCGIELEKEKTGGLVQINPEESVRDELLQRAMEEREAKRRAKEKKRNKRKGHSGKESEKRKEEQEQEEEEEERRRKRSRVNDPAGAKAILEAYRREQEEEGGGIKVPSAAIQAIYTKGRNKDGDKEGGDGGFLVRGTFTRYAA